MSAPLVVNTRDGMCWTRRTVTSSGIALYAPQGVCQCPEFVMATLVELAEHGIVGSADVLPVPVGSATAGLADERIELIRKKRTHCEAAQFEAEDDRQPHVWGPSSYPKREMCQRCTVTREWAEDSDADDVVLLAEVDRLRAKVAELLAERHVTNEALGDAVQELGRREAAPLKGRARLGASAAAVAEATHWRRLGVEDPHDSPLHHRYDKGRDVPPIGGATC